MIPPSQIFYGDAESIGDGDQSVAATHGISLRTCAGSGCRDGYDKLVSGIEAVIQSHAVGCNDVACMGMQSGCDTVECLAGTYYVKAPAAAFVFRNLFEALGEDVVGADGYVQ